MTGNGETDDTGRRTFLKAAGVAGAAVAGLGGTAAAQETETATGEDGDDGLITVSSDESVETTVERITETIEESEDLTLVGSVDHAENAESVGQELRPTTLLLFGNPEIGTLLMQQSQTAGVDLPQKLLVWEDNDGSVYVTYNDPAYVTERHGIIAPEQQLSMIRQALQQLAEGE